jgi:hypothetical protein
MISSWNKLRHPAKLPLSCLREKLDAPKLRISVLMKVFAVSMGHMKISIVAPCMYNESDSNE